MSKCLWHICTNEAQEHNKFCGSKCKNKYYVDRRRKAIKQKAVEYKGNMCFICGYNKCNDALQFHHMDPSEKDFNISQNGHSRSWERVKKELDKCMLICANCHAELHMNEHLTIKQQ